MIPPFSQFVETDIDWSMFALGSRMWIRQRLSNISKKTTTEEADKRLKPRQGVTQSPTANFLLVTLDFGYLQ
jgi:hypothetical protein